MDVEANVAGLLGPDRQSIACDWAVGQPIGSIEAEMVPERPLAGLRVLVVEDDYFLADDLRWALASAGVAVIGPVASVAQAMQQVERDGFDIAILDLNLRDEMAYPLVVDLERHKVPFVFVTGYDQSVIPIRFADVSRLEKPFEAHQLIAELSRLRFLDPG